MIEKYAFYINPYDIISDNLTSKPFRMSPSGAPLGYSINAKVGIYTSNAEECMNSNARKYSPSLENAEF